MCLAPRLIMHVLQPEYNCPPRARGYASTVVMGLCLALVVPAWAAVESTSATIRQVSEIPCPDPFVFHDGSDWYVFGTGGQPFFLQGKTLGDGQMRKVLLDIDYGDFALPVAHIWGFVVERETSGECHAYGTLHLGKFHTVIAAFEPREGRRWEAGRPVTHWRFHRLLVGDPARENWNCYESKILRHPDGSRYLMYVERQGRDNVILTHRLKSWSERDETASPRVLLRPEGFRSEDRNTPGGLQLVEGPSIFQWRNTFVLLYSVGDYARGNYKLGMAFSDTLIPPPGRYYEKVRRPDPGRVWGEGGSGEEIGYLLQSEKPGWPNYSAGAVVGPGLGSIVSIDQTPWLFFHGYAPGDRERRPENRLVFRAPLTIAIDHGPPRLEWMRVTLPE